MTITSSAFRDKETIPEKYTCDGEGFNPPLQFNDVSDGAKSLVLLVDDPDVPKNLKPDGVFDHWVIYNIDPSATGIAESGTSSGMLGMNSAGKTSYAPACPPDREHRYFFKLYALDSKLAFDNPSKVTKQLVEEQMQGHILEQAELIGLYSRKK